MKTKKIILSLILCFCIVYIVCFTNIILNHSCVGITYARNPSLLGTDLVVRYFKSEYEAKKLYKDEGIDTYYLVAVTADNSKGYLDSEEWFFNLCAPLMCENTKYVITDSIDVFAKENELMLYYVGPGLEDGYIDKDEIDDTVDMYEIGSEWMGTSDNCTDAEKEFHIMHCGYAFTVKDCFEKYKISVEANDAYSIMYWHQQLSELFNKWERPPVPTTERKGIDWNDIDGKFTQKIDLLKEYVKKMDEGIELEEEDWSLIKSTALAYEANVISLNRDLNSASIDQIDDSNTEQNIIPEVEIKMVREEENITSDSYEIFLYENSEYGENVIIIPNVEVRDFKLFLLDGECLFNKNEFVVSEILYTCENLLPSKPFVTRVYYEGYSSSHYGISYKDTLGTEYRFIIYESGEDGSFYLEPF